MVVYSRSRPYSSSEKSAYSGCLLSTSQFTCLFPLFSWITWRNLSHEEIFQNCVALWTFIYNSTLFLEDINIDRSDWETENSLILNYSVESQNGQRQQCVSLTLYALLLVELSSIGKGIYHLEKHQNPISDGVDERFSFHSHIWMLPVSQCSLSSHSCKNW